MEHAHARINDWVSAVMIPLALLATLPFIALVAFVLRPVLLVTALVLLLSGAVAWTFSGRFRAWLEVATEPEAGHRGLRLPQDVALHPGHAWARLNNVVVVGADDLLQAALGPLKHVDLPAVGARLRRDEPLFTLHGVRRSASVPSPVSGTVVGRNTALEVHPGLVNRHPFGQGWVVRLRGDDLGSDWPRLLRGRRARSWFRRQVDRVAAGLPPGVPGPDPRAPLPTGELHRHLGDAAWSRMRG
jgi:glycine cleavage system H protein